MLALSDAELALGRQAAAKRAFEQAQARAIGVSEGTRLDSAVGLARVALMQCDGAAALQAIQDFMARWANGGMIGSAGDLRLFKLTCYRVLERAGDPRAAEWLERAHTELQSTAARVSDKRLRECFLANIPHHREIVAAWQQAQRQGGGGNAGVR